MGEAPRPSADLRCAGRTTDGNTLFYGPSFEALPLPEQIGLVAHEVLHIALRHPQRYLELKQLLGDVDLKLYNICADAIVNSSLSHLSWLRLPRGAVLLEDLLWTTLGAKMDAQAALLEWDVERLYRTMDDREDNSPKSGKSEKRQQSGGSEQSNSGDDKKEQVSSSNETEDRKDGPKSSRGNRWAPTSLWIWFRRLIRTRLPKLKLSTRFFGVSACSAAMRATGCTPCCAPCLPTCRRCAHPGSRFFARNWRAAFKEGGHILVAACPVLHRKPAALRRRHMPFEPGFSLAKPTPRLVVIVDVWDRSTTI